MRSLDGGGDERRAGEGERERGRVVESADVKLNCINCSLAAGSGMEVNPHTFLQPSSNTSTGWRRS